MPDAFSCKYSHFVLQKLTLISALRITSMQCGLNLSAWCQKAAAVASRLKSRLKLLILEDGEQSLGASPMENYSLLVIACPRRPLTATDIACAHHFVATGGSLLVLAEAGGDLVSGDCPTCSILQHYFPRLI